MILAAILNRGAGAAVLRLGSPKTACSTTFTPAIKLNSVSNLDGIHIGSTEWWLSAPFKRKERCAAGVGTERRKRHFDGAKEIIVKAILLSLSANVKQIFHAYLHIAGEIEIESRAEIESPYKIGLLDSSKKSFISPSLSQLDSEDRQHLLAETNFDRNGFRAALRILIYFRQESLASEIQRMIKRREEGLKLKSAFPFRFFKVTVRGVFNADDVTLISWVLPGVFSRVGSDFIFAAKHYAI